jgi:hypothetical protein
VEEGFLNPKHRSLLIVEAEPRALLDRFKPFIETRAAARFDHHQT